MTNSDETAKLRNCEVCGRPLVDGFRRVRIVPPPTAHGGNIHHLCERAIKYVDALITTERARDLCELQEGNIVALRRMLLDAFLAGGGMTPAEPLPTGNECVR